MVPGNDKPPDHNDAVECRSCGSPVWPDYNGQPHRNCDNCDNRVWFDEWAKEQFGGDTPPKFVNEGPTSDWEKESEGKDDPDGGTQSNLGEY